MLLLYFIVYSYLFMFFNADEYKIIVDKIVSSRMLIVTTQAKINIERVHVQNGIVDKKSYKLNVWSDNDHCRVDHLTSGERDLMSNVGYEQIICNNCEKPGYFVSAIRGKQFTAKIEKSDLLNKLLLSQNIDLRILGIDAINYPNLMPRTVNIEDDIRRRLFSEECEKCSVKQDPTDSSLCYLESYYRRSGSRRIITVDKSKNYLVTSIVLYLVKGETTYDTKYTLGKVREVSPGIWYPEEIQYTKMENGKEMFSEFYTISNLVFNQPIAASVFSLAGMGLEDGTRIEIVDRPYEKLVLKSGKVTLFSKNNELEAEKLPPLPEPIPIPNPTPSPRWPYALGAGIFAIVTVYFLRRLIISRTG